MSIDPKTLYEKNPTGRDEGSTGKVLEQIVAKVFGFANDWHHPAASGVFVMNSDSPYDEPFWITDDPRDWSVGIDIGDMKSIHDWFLFGFDPPTKHPICATSHDPNYQTTPPPRTPSVISGMSGCPGCVNGSPTTTTTLPPDHPDAVPSAVATILVDGVEVRRNLYGVAPTLGKEHAEMIAAAEIEREAGNGRKLVRVSGNRYAWRMA